VGMPHCVFPSSPRSRDTCTGRTARLLAGRTAPGHTGESVKLWDLCGFRGSPPLLDPDPFPARRFFSDGNWLAQMLSRGQLHLLARAVWRTSPHGKPRTQNRNETLDLCSSCRPRLGLLCARWLERPRRLCQYGTARGTCLLGQHSRPHAGLPAPRSPSPASSRRHRERTPGRHSDVLGRLRRRR